MDGNGGRNKQPLSRSARMKSHKTQPKKSVNRRINGKTLRSSKNKRPIFKKWWFWAILLLFVIAGTQLIVDPNNGEKPQTEAQTSGHKKGNSKTSSKKSSSNKQNTSSSSKSVSTSSDSKKQPAWDFSSIKLGMTKEQVIAFLGKPTEELPNTLIYDRNEIDFDTNGKVMNGTPSSISEQADAAEQKAIQESKNKAESASESSRKQQQIVWSAQRFGELSSQHLSKYPSVYRAVQIGDSIAYLNKLEDGTMLVRYDSPNLITNVYIYDSTKDYGMGQLLYTGRTNLQDKAKTYNFW
ncbi:hypothetical protein [Schleiferilactobacillus harbinensis]|uniref:hypothetical protein n=1 Tax=Schleiferilactobacillus harbinensis TaxID=304207 RepID=UPI00345E0920